MRVREQHRGTFSSRNSCDVTNIYSKAQQYVLPPFSRLCLQGCVQNNFSDLRTNVFSRTSADTDFTHCIHTSNTPLFERKLTIELKRSHCRQYWVSVAVIRPFSQHLDSTLL